MAAKLWRCSVARVENFRPQVSVGKYAWFLLFMAERAVNWVLSIKANSSITDVAAAIEKCLAA